MAEPAPKISGDAANEGVATQPPASLPENQTGEGTSKAQTEGQKTSGDAAPWATVPAADTDTSPKAKDKAEHTTLAPASHPVGSTNPDDSLSIEPSGPALANAAAEISTPAPVCAITLLLPTGARHPYRIDEKYLTKRGVDIPDLNESGWKDPFSISVYKLKELILREWREEWEGKPASPSSIRLIHFGKLLDDKEQLKKYHFSQDSPNVVHMSVRPPEMMEEDETAKGKTGGREGRSRDGGSGCCVIL
ncbi:hypothetical protein VTJ83DRAFT_4136 [Remersonia thermophila]|uniref:UBL3-like ubiquitin domain-containing protein n=1 Tax=Remersonia thermophila TaxID=72144 RepID=A0ABR4D913_9PEZI